ncbi:MAG: hypothetical protein Q8M92_08470, partial [Candidatus Subteraquimicrobiales bacterium]|nr:hypothetical protein [Candidatus Subteraquimicrobiales bacterium]
TVNTGSTANDITVSTTVTWDGTKIYDDVIINSGGSITHSANTTTNQYNLNLIALGNLSINGTGKIDATGKGFAAGSGPGAGNGASYGGGSLAYGSISSPDDLGSGGNAGNAPGSGGGLIRLNISGTLTNNGAINVNGNLGGGGICTYWDEWGYCSSFVPAGAGGSGGTVYVSVGTFAGSGSITVNGGNTGASDGYGQTNGGSGGRIAVYSTARTYSGTITANGGIGNGGAGTVYQKQGAYAANRDEQSGDLTLDNNSVSGAATPAMTTALTLANLTIQKNANLSIPSGRTVTSTNLTIQWIGVASVASGGALTTTNFTLATAGTFTTVGSMTTSNLTVNGAFNLNTNLSVNPTRNLA